MENKDDKLLKDFFSQNKEEIQDNDFSQKIMNQLPEKQRNIKWIVPLFALIGIVVSALTVDIRDLLNDTLYLLFNTPIYYLIGGFMLIPIVVLFCYLYWERKHDQFIIFD